MENDQSTGHEISSFLVGLYHVRVEKTICSP
jgi:hypothetical protein